MADEFPIGSGNWWDSSKTRYDSGSGSSSSSSQSSQSSTSLSSSTFGWPVDMVLDMKSRSSMAMDSPASVSCSSGSIFRDTQKPQGSDSSGGGGGGALADLSLQVMGLGLPSQSMDWNQTLFRGEKGETSFRSLLQEDHSSSSTNYRQESGIELSSQDHWKQKIYAASGEDSQVMSTEFKQINRGFSLDHMSSNNVDGTTGAFQVDSSGAYGSPSSAMLQALQNPNFENRPVMNYPYDQSNYGVIANELSTASCWPKYPPKQQPAALQGQLQFANKAPFWNASMAALNNSQSGFFPLSQTQFSTPNFEEKPKINPSEIRDLGTMGKKISNEPSAKKPRSETPSSTSPPFKVRKEKMGDRITALQQLVSPFGKTDTASVLSEAIEYIKFLHEQVSVLSTPYMKSGPSTHNQQSFDEAKDPEGAKQDLRSRGLCLVPVSSTFPVTHDTTVDYWTPTFGGTFR